MQRAPLFWFAVAASLGIGAVELVRPLPVLTLLPLLVLPFLKRAQAVLVCFLVLGAGRHAWVSTTGLQAFHQQDGQRIVIEGHWLSEELLQTGRGPLQIPPRGGQVGHRARVEGVISRPPNAPLGGYDQRAHLAGQGVYWQLVPSAPWVDLGPAPWRPHRIVAALRQRFVAPLEALLPEGVAELLAVLLFGEGQVAKGTRAAFAEAGAAHLLAISGTHLSLGVLPLMSLFHAFGLPRGRAAPWVLPWLFAYALVAGLKAPVARAAVMGGLTLLSFSLERPRAGLNGLGLAGLLLLLLQPAALFTASFQFSFAATLGILLLAPPLRAWLNRRLPRDLAAPLAVGLAAQLLVEPLALYHFGTFSPVGVVSNLLLLPLAGFVIPLGLATALLGALWLPLAQSIAWLLRPVTEGLLGLVELFAALPGGHFAPGPISWGWLPLWLGLLACLRFGRWPPWRWGVAACLVFTLAVLPWPQRKGGLSVWFLDVGQGDGIAIKTPGGDWWLIDGGRPEAAEAVLLPFLRRQGAKGLRGIIATHADADHVGGLGPVVETLPVGAVYGPGLVGGDGAAYLRLQAAAHGRGVPLLPLARGQQLLLAEGVVAEVLHPAGQLGSRQAERNANSIVVRLTYQGVSLLLTGDLEGAAEAELLRCCRAQLAATVLKVAHHGSNSSSATPFLRAVGAEVAVIPVGPNQYGHPHPDVLARLKAEAVALYRTDRQGHLSLMIDGGQLRWRGRGLGRWVNLW